METQDPYDLDWGISTVELVSPDGSIGLHLFLP